MELITDADPNNCRLRLTQAELDALANSASEAEHQELLGRTIYAHLKAHHNYGSSDPKKPSINLQHQVIG